MYLELPVVLLTLKELLIIPVGVRYNGNFIAVNEFMLTDDSKIYG